MPSELWKISLLKLKIRTWTGKTLPREPKNISQISWQVNNVRYSSHSLLSVQLQQVIIFIGPSFPIFNYIAMSVWCTVNSENKPLHV